MRCAHQYYGSQSHDFTEPVLTRLAQQSLAANKVDDALAWAKLNLENFRSRRRRS